MKKQTNQLKALFTLVLVISSLGFYSAAQAAAITVGLKVNASQDGLEATTRGTCTKGNNPNGCVGVAPGKKININFNLPSAKCDGDEKWQLGQVTLATTEKGTPGGIGSDAASDFNADEVTGIVTPKTKSGNHILIRDNNSAEYDIWYTVSASCGGKTIDLDPRIENGGER